MTSFFMLFKTIIFLLAIIFLIKIVLNYVNQFSQPQDKSMQVIERLTISKESSLAIILICGSYYLMSLSPNKNQVIKKLNEIETQEVILRQEMEKEQVARRTDKVIEVMYTSNLFKLRKKGSRNGKME